MLSSSSMSTGVLQSMSLKKNENSDFVNEQQRQYNYWCRLTNLQMGQDKFYSIGLSICRCNLHPHFNRTT